MMNRTWFVSRRLMCGVAGCVAAGMLWAAPGFGAVPTERPSFPSEDGIVLGVVDCGQNVVLLVTDFVAEDGRWLRVFAYQGEGVVWVYGNTEGITSAVISLPNTVPVRLSEEELRATYPEPCAVMAGFRTSTRR